MPYIEDRPTVRELLEARAARDGDRVYCRFEDRAVTFAELDRDVNRLANALLGLGIGPGDRVPVMLGNHLDHVLVFFALMKLGAMQVPVNVHLRGAGLGYLLEHSEPKAVIADAAFAEHLGPALEAHAVETVIWRGGRTATSGAARAVDFAALAASGSDAPPPGGPGPDDVVSISYTSGTTGPPKGVMVTDRMFRAAASAVAIVADVRPREVMFMWEPIYHIGGSQVIVLAVMRDISLAMVPRFSASRLWDQVREAGATQLHYLGGVLQILLRQPPRDDDRDNPVRIAWGGGAPANIWREFEDRFGVQIRENYGMTEASSLTTLNTEGKPGSVGRPAPYFEVRIADDDGRPLGPNLRGEILVRGKEPGVIMKGYFKNPEATAAALRGGWLHTGDLGSYDETGLFYFAGRKKDSIRRRGENVSAWEVEHVVAAHPDVEECAVIGVEAEVGEQEIKLFVKPAAGKRPEPRDLIAWCAKDLARFQTPRYVAFVDAFPKTATQRIQKDKLSRAVTDCWDMEQAGAPAGRG